MNVSSSVEAAQGKAAAFENDLQAQSDEVGRKLSHTVNELERTHLIAEQLRIQKLMSCGEGKNHNISDAYKKAAQLKGILGANPHTIRVVPATRTAVSARAASTQSKQSAHAVPLQSQADPGMLASMQAGSDGPNHNHHRHRRANNDATNVMAQQEHKAWRMAISQTSWKGTNMSTHTFNTGNPFHKHNMQSQPTHQDSKIVKPLSKARDFLARVHSFTDKQHHGNDAKHWGEGGVKKMDAFAESRPSATIATFHEHKAREDPLYKALNKQTKDQHPARSHHNVSVGDDGDLPHLRRGRRSQHSKSDRSYSPTHASMHETGGEEQREARRRKSRSPVRSKKSLPCEGVRSEVRSPECPTRGKDAQQQLSHQHSHAAVETADTGAAGAGVRGQLRIEGSAPSYEYAGSEVKTAPPTAQEQNDVSASHLLLHHQVLSPPQSTSPHAVHVSATPPHRRKQHHHRHERSGNGGGGGGAHTTRGNKKGEEGETSGVKAHVMTPASEAAPADPHVLKVEAGGCHLLPIPLPKRTSTHSESVLVGSHSDACRLLRERTHGRNSSRTQSRGGVSSTAGPDVNVGSSHVAGSGSGSLRLAMAPLPPGDDSSRMWSPRALAVIPRQASSVSPPPDVGCQGDGAGGGAGGDESGGAGGGEGGGEDRKLVANEGEAGCNLKRTGRRRAKMRSTSPAAGDRRHCGVRAGGGAALRDLASGVDNDANAQENVVRSARAQSGGPSPDASVRLGGIEAGAGAENGGSGAGGHAAYRAAYIESLHREVKEQVEALKVKLREQEKNESNRKSAQIDLLDKFMKHADSAAAAASESAWADERAPPRYSSDGPEGGEAGGRHDRRLRAVGGRRRRCSKSPPRRSEEVASAREVTWSSRQVSMMHGAERDARGGIGGVVGEQEEGGGEGGERGGGGGGCSSGEVGASAHLLGENGNSQCLAAGSEGRDEGDGGKGNSSGEGGGGDDGANAGGGWCKEEAVGNTPPMPPLACESTGAEEGTHGTLGNEKVGQNKDTIRQRSNTSAHSPEPNSSHSLERKDPKLSPASSSDAASGEHELDISGSNNALSSGNKALASALHPPTRTGSGQSGGAKRVRKKAVSFEAGGGAQQVGAADGELRQQRDGSVSTRGCFGFGFWFRRGK